MTTLFVTGSGTGIGKTFLCCRLLAALPNDLSVRAIKPVVTGVSDTNPISVSDTGLLIGAQGLAVDEGTIAATSPWRFAAPLSADMAAAREGRSIDFGALVEFSRSPPDVDLNLVEGIGGVMAPLDARHTVLDWIAALDASALLVVGSYLGALSHALTAHAALVRLEIDVLAVVVSQSIDEPVPTDESLATLRRFLGATPLLKLPRAENASAAEVAALVLKRIASS